MKAPKILNRVYSLMHPLSHRLEVSDKIRETRGWLLGFFVFSILMYIDVIRNLQGKESFTGLPYNTFIWLMGIVSIACLILARDWFRVLVKLIFKKKKDEV